MSVYIPVDMYFTPVIRCWKNLKMTLKVLEKCLNLTLKNVYET